MIESIFKRKLKKNECFFEDSSLFEKRTFKRKLKKK